MKTMNIALLLLFLTLYPLQASDYPALASSDNHASIISEDIQSISLGFELNNLEIREIVRENRTFDALAIPGEGITYEYGRPVLPSISRFVVVPPQVGLELLVESGEPRIEKASNPPAVCDDENLIASIKADLPDNAIYPPQIATMSEPIVIRGVRLVKVTTYPVRYDPSSGSYLHYDHIRTDIQFTNEEPVNPAYHPNRRHRSSQFLKFIEALAINGENVRRDQPIDEIPPYVGHYLIVTHQNCLQYAAPFIEWRRKAGYKVDILSLADDDARDENVVEDAIQEYYDAYLDDNIDPFDYILLIGDRSNYNYGTGANWILDAHRGESLWGGANQADYKYACLEGNDNIPDVGFSRWPNGNRDLMELVVGKTLAYETDPPMDDPEWFNTTGVYSQHWGNSATSSWHPSLHTTVRWGVEVLESLGFEDVDTYEYFEWDRQGARIGPWIRDHYNDGTNILIGRAQNYFWRQNFNGVEDNTVFAIDLNIGHFPWTSENSFRTGSRDHLKGPVAVTYCYSEPAPMTPMNLVWLNLVKGVLLCDLPLGWGRIYAVTAFEESYPDIQYRNVPVYLHIKTDVGCFGDPGLQPWIDVPTAVNTEYTNQLSPEARALTVHVTNREDDEDLADAQVTIYHPGDMPDPDSDDYATYDEMFMMTTFSDDDGIARFVFPEDFELESGIMFVTISGRDICPEFGEIAIEQPELALDISRYSLMEVAGNDDDEINPGERFFMLLYAKNLGSDVAAEEVSAELSTHSPYLELGRDNIGFDDIEPDEEVLGWGAIELRISPTCPDAASRPVTCPVIDITLNANDETWYSAIKLNPIAPNLEVNQIIGGDIIELDVTEIDIELENTGAMDIAEFSAELVALEYGISVTRRSGDYPEIEAGGTSRLDSAPFLVTGSTLAIPGTQVEMALILSNEDDYIDTAYFELQVREPMENAPTGPDEYGYICFDDTDTDGWDLAPEYDWIEICPEEDDCDFEGSLIEFEGRSQHDIGEAAVINLGFTTVFYGHEYNQITVATNGFIAMGEQERIVNFQNWPLDRGIGGGMGMIAPFWDDLRLRDGGVYYFHDEDNGRFIVEWYKIRHADGGINEDLTFQVVLYDREVWPSLTGNQRILIQYREIVNEENMRQGDDEWEDNTPYASVGISSPDGTTGISYTWNNEYLVSAAPLEPRRALLFTTALFETHEGLLTGTVTDAADDAPLEDVLISTNFGQNTVSDEEGRWEITEAFTGFEFDLRFSLEGYNDSIITDLFLEENERLRVDVALLHPEFVPSQWLFVEHLEPELTAEIDFTVENTGNGPLDWALERRLPRGADADPWEHRWSYAAQDSVQDTRLEGLVYIDGRFYISGANIFNRVDTTNMIWIMDHEGSLVDSFPQLGTGNYGMRDLTWDGELIWGSGEELVYGFTTEGDSATSFEGPYNPNTVITWDTDRDVFWIGRKTGAILHAYNIDGEEVENMRLDQMRLRIYGLAYWQDDPDGFPLYIMNSPDNRTQMVYKMNPDNGDTQFVATLEPEAGGMSGGITITNQFDVYSWVFMTMVNDPQGDRIDVWQVEGRRDWFRVFEETDTGRVAAMHGRIDAEQTQEFALLFCSDDLPPEVDFNGFLVYRHDTTRRPSDTLSVLLHVIGELPPTEFSLLTPADDDTVRENPGYDTTRVSFSWEESFDYNQDEEVSYLAWFRSGSDSAMIECGRDNFLMVEMIELAENLELPIEEEWLLEWYVLAVGGEDRTYSREIFTLRIIPNSISDTDKAQPVEFGLHSIYPSPFNSMTTIRIGVDVKERTNLQIFDLAGRRVVTLLDRSPSVGYYAVIWDASALPSGLYLVRLESAGRARTAKVALIR